MSAEIELLTQKLLEATLFIHFLGGTVLALGGWIWFEGWLKRNGCPQCGHCKKEKDDRSRRQREATEKYLGLDPQSQAQRERLFGKQVADKEPPKDENEDKS